MRRLVAALLILVAGSAAAQEQEPPKRITLTELMDTSKADATRFRGLPFLADVEVRKTTDAEFRVKVRRDIRRIFGKGAEDLTEAEELLKLLRVIPKDGGLLNLMDDFLPGAVVANYDPFVKRIAFLRAARTLALTKSIMVHELTHALQDQHFNLEQMIKDGEPTLDRLLALGALVEGDAERTQRTYDTGGVLALTPIQTIRRIGQAEVKKYLARNTHVPMAVARPFIFQYLDGLVFVESVRRARGGTPAAVNGIFRDPPQSTEQILHPERYLDRDRPTRILPPAPPDGFRLAFENVLGELGVGIVLASHLGEKHRAAAAEGWGGDRILLLRTADAAPVLAWYTSWDTEKDAREFLLEAEEMLRLRHPESEVRELPGKAGVLLVDEGRLHALTLSDRDVFLVEGVPRESSTEFLRRMAAAKKVRLVVEETPFGGSD